jgi:drug/metabolite transporter (DMT)-like permease
MATDTITDPAPRSTAKPGTPSSKPAQPASSRASAAPTQDLAASSAHGRTTSDRIPATGDPSPSPAAHGRTTLDRIPATGNPSPSSATYDRTASSHVPVTNEPSPSSTTHGHTASDRIPAASDPSPSSATHGHTASGRILATGDQSPSPAARDRTDSGRVPAAGDRSPSSTAHDRTTSSRVPVTGEPSPSSGTASGYRLGAIAVVAAAALWGLGGVLADGLFRHGVQPLDLVSVRTYISALGLGLIIAARRRRRGRIHGPAARVAPAASLRHDGDSTSGDVNESQYGRSGGADVTQGEPSDRVTRNESSSRIAQNASPDRVAHGESSGRVAQNASSDRVALNESSGRVTAAWRERVRSLFSLRRADVLGFGLSIGVANAALFTAIRLLPVAAAMVLQSLAPVLVVGWECVRDRVRPSVVVLAGLAIALPGVALVAGTAGPNGSHLDPVGLLAGLVTAVGVAAFALFGHSVTRTRGAIEANALAFTVSAAGWLIYELCHGLPSTLFHASVLPGVLGVAVLGTLLPFVLFAWGSERTGPLSGALSICLEPAFGAVLAWIWLGQSLSVAQIFGALLVTGAVAAIQYSTYRRTR